MFTIIGERINTSREAVREAVEKRDRTYIQEDASRQAAAGATFIDVNAGARYGHELSDLQWLIEVIQERVSLPLSLDSPDPRVLEEAWQLVTQPPMINSISLEKDRFEPLLCLLAGRDCRVIALCMSDAGLPASDEEVVGRAGKLLEGLARAGISAERVHVDPLIQPVATDVTKGRMAMESVRRIMVEFPGVHTACGLSNISYGLPQRQLVNRSFLPLLMACGLDGAILDPLDSRIIGMLKATGMLLGQDAYCMDFLKAVRAGQIGG